HDVAGRHPFERFFERLVAVDGDILFDVFGVDPPAVGENDPVLFSEEAVLVGNVVARGDDLLGIEASTLQVPVENGGYLLRREPAEEDDRAVRPRELDEWFLVAHSDAAGLFHRDGGPAAFQLFHDLVVYLARSGG